MAGIEWSEAGAYADILYHKAEGIAKITINRPRVRNAFRKREVLFDLQGGMVVFGERRGR